MNAFFPFFPKNFASVSVESILNVHKLNNFLIFSKRKMKIIPKAEIISRLNKIYAQIPSFDCKHCQQCSNPIMWFKAEQINIKDYLQKHHLSFLTLSEEEFRQYQMKCPYLHNNRCCIYPVRPIVCRLQGVIPELSCPFNNSVLLSKEQYFRIINEFNALNREIGGIYEYFGTRKEISNHFISEQKS